MPLVSTLSATPGRVAWLVGWSGSITMTSTGRCPDAAMTDPAIDWLARTVARDPRFRAAASFLTDPVPGERVEVEGTAGDVDGRQVVAWSVSGVYVGVLPSLFDGVPQHHLVDAVRSGFRMPREAVPREWFTNGPQTTPQDPAEARRILDGLRALWVEVSEGREPVDRFRAVVEGCLECGVPVPVAVTDLVGL